MHGATTSAGPFAKTLIQGHVDIGLHPILV